MYLLYFSVLKVCLSNMLLLVESKYGSNVSPLVVEVSAQTSERVHLKIFDPRKKRWEIPKRFDQN